MADNDNVLLYPGITPFNMPADVMLDKAKGHLDDVVIVGWDKDGDLFFSSSIGNGPEVNWLLDLAKRELLNVGAGDYDDDFDDLC